MARQARLLATVNSEVTLEVSAKTLLFEYTVPIPHLPKDLSGLSILHLSDLHLRPSRPKRAEEVSALTRYLISKGHRIDALIISGDIIDTSPKDLHLPSLEALANLVPARRRFFVLGNHDYCGKSSEKVAASMAHLGFTNLTNGFAEADLGKSHLHLFGLGERKFDESKISQEISRTSGDVNILLTHDLDNLTRKAPDSFDLVLSGHYHGGEIHIGPVNGVHFLRMIGYSRNINGQSRGWDMLTDRALSYVSPGLSRHWPTLSSSRPGATILKLVSGEKMAYPSMCKDWAPRIDSK